MAYVIIYFFYFYFIYYRICLALMAAFSVNLKLDKLSPLAVTVVSGLTVYLDCINLYPKPIEGLSYLNGFHIVSNIVLLPPIFGNILSSYLRSKNKEAAAKKVECITTVVVPLISVVVNVIVLFYFFGADVEDKVGADLEAGRIEL